MKKDMLRFFPVLILILVACNFANAGATPVPTPTPGITPSATNIPLPGDLGFGDVTGKVTDAETGLPIADATVTCEHYSYTSKESDRCNRTTTTDQDGVFLFEKVFFHDTDNITLTVKASGYQTQEVKQAFFTLNHWEANISMHRAP
jgi:hypothetical protein